MPISISASCDKALIAYDKALELVVDPAERIETQHSRSICLIGLGKLEEGFREYEIRNNERFRCYFHHIIDAPRWQGEDVRGKKLLLVGEQGLGDEIMFANILPDAQEAVGETGKLQICVDPRMVPLYQRSFPKAEVGGYDDRTLIDKDGNKALRLIPFASKDNKPDFWAPMGTRPAILPQVAWPISRTSRSWCRTRRGSRTSSAQLAALPGKKVGICWRSMMMGGQARQIFLAHRRLGRRSCKTPGITFVNLQYGDCAADIARAKEKFGVTIHQMEGLDLKDDIDGTAALCAGARPGAVGAHGRRPYRRQRGRRSLVPVAPASAGRNWERRNIPGIPTPACSGRQSCGDWDAVLPRFAAATGGIRRRVRACSCPAGPAFAPFAKAATREIVQTQISGAAESRRRPASSISAPAATCGHLQQWPPVPPELMAYHYRTFATYELFGDPERLRAAPPSRHAARFLSLAA